MDKESTIEKVLESDIPDGPAIFTQKELNACMDEFAKAQATEFAELVAYYYEPIGGKPPGVIFEHVDGPAKYNIEELYAIFLEQNRH